MIMIPFRAAFMRSNQQQKKPTQDVSKPVLNPSHHESSDDSCSDAYVSMNPCALNAESDRDYSSSINRNYSIDRSPTPSEAITDVLMDDVKDEDLSGTQSTQNQAISNTNFTYDQITQVLGEDTSMDDYLSNLFHEEKCNNSLSWYSKRNRTRVRRNTVEWIRNTSIHLKLQESTLFKTIYYFDKLCSIKQMNPDHLMMVAAVCLFIASKFNEREYDIPHVRRIARECGNKYPTDVFYSSEKKILSALDFRLKVVLPIDFVQHYIYQKGVIFDDDRMDDQSNARTCALPSDLHLKQSLNQDLHKFCVFFLHIAALSYSFWNYKPSVLAFVVICAARRTMTIKPYFNRKLVDTCHYEAMDVNECFNKLWNKYEAKFPEKAKLYESVQPKSLIDF